MIFRKGQRIRLSVPFGEKTPAGSEGSIIRDGLSPLGFVAISVKGEMLMARPSEIVVSTEERCIPLDPQPPHWASLPIAEASTAHGVFSAGFAEYSFVLSVPDGFTTAEYVGGFWYWVA